MSPISTQDVSKIREVPLNFFGSPKVGLMDFVTFEKILRDRYFPQIRNESGFQAFKRKILKDVADGRSEPIKTRSEILVDGYARLLAHQVLGIFPLVEGN